MAKTIHNTPGNTSPVYTAHSPTPQASTGPSQGAQMPQAFYRGKGGKGGKGIAKRHNRGRDKYGAHNIGLPAMRRLARRAGSSRVTLNALHEARDLLGAITKPIVRDAKTYCEYARRKIVQPMDVAYAIKRNHGDNCSVYLAKDKDGKV